MSRLEAWLVHAATLLVGATGLVYAWMRHLATPADPYSVVNHPWQPMVQHLHVWSAPLLVFAAGVIWREHVWSHWRRGIRSRRRSGLSLVLTLAPMVVSGYLIQTAVTPVWRTAWVAVHLVASGLWLAGYLVHQVVPLWRSRARRISAERRPQGAGRPAAAVALVAIGLAGLGTVGLGLAGCRREPPPPPEETAPAAGPVSLACGLDEGVVGPLLARFTATTGYEVEARYGDSGELADDLLTSPAPSAQVFLSRDAPDLGRVAAAGLLLPLAPDLLDRVDDHFADPEGRWVGLLGRARALVYATARVPADDLPDDLAALVDLRFRPRLGVAPGSDSFVDQMAAYRALNGAQRLAAFLAGLSGEGVTTYRDEAAAAEAVLDGELDVALVDHDVALTAGGELEDHPLGIHVLASGDSSGFVNLAGVGVLSANPAATELVRFLLSEATQSELASETRQYPLIEGLALAGAPVPLAELAVPRIDFAQVAGEEAATRRAIEASGLLPPE